MTITLSCTALTRVFVSCNSELSFTFSMPQLKKGTHRGDDEELIRKLV